MKIRGGFVTNSSSCSYTTISITNKKLVEILKKYDGLGKYFDTCSFDENECCIKGVDLYECTPQKLNDVMDTLIEFLSETTDCWVDEDEETEIQEDDEPFLNMIKELTEQKKELTSSIEAVDWKCDSGSWGGDSDYRMFESSYSKEVLNEIYAKIAKEKGCSVDEVTHDDFCDYVGGKDDCRIRHFTYNRDKRGKGKYTESYGLVDI